MKKGAKKKTPLFCPKKSEKVRKDMSEDHFGVRHTKEEKYGIYFMGERCLFPIKMKSGKKVRTCVSNQQKFNDAKMFGDLLRQIFVKNITEGDESDTDQSDRKAETVHMNGVEVEPLSHGIQNDPHD